MGRIKFIWVGKLKKKYWQESSIHYMNRLDHSYKITEIIVKDAPTHFKTGEKKKWEGEKILQQTQAKDFIIALDEKGKSLSSAGLASCLQNWTEHPVHAPCFIIGGAYGLAQEVIQASHFALSLSAMTFPHEMARVVLLEQIYRATAILKGSGYHHE